MTKKLTTNDKSSKERKTLLVAMPWASYGMPSIQVAALKAYLHCHGVSAEAAHWFVEIAHAIGFNDYNKLAYPFLECGEAVYSYLYFTEMRKSILQDDWFIENATRACEARQDLPSAELPLFWNREFFKKFERLHVRILDRYDWSEYALVGFTLNYGQNLSSLFMAREIKRRNPDVKIIFGGSEASRELGESLITHFPEIDYTCNGEGEKPLLHLALALTNDVSEEEIRNIKGLIGRDANGNVWRNPPDQITAMNELPTPDFAEYFAVIEGMPDLSVTDVTTSLPIESSRGCYYACNFCALNLQWENFRSQDPETMARMMRELAREHGILNFLFMDNITPKNTDAIFERVLKDGMDYHFFYEIRANLPRKSLKIMAEAGLKSVQVGIEALSTSLLKKFNKKSRVIHNLQSLKNCEELGVVISGNLIVNYPSSSIEEVEETLYNMDYMMHCRPPSSTSEFSLEVGAPDYGDALKKGIKILGNQPEYAKLYPEKLFKSLLLLRQDCRPTTPIPNWSAVETKLEEWKNTYEANVTRLGPGKPHLVYRDGGTFLRIEDHRSGNLEIYFMNDWERGVYLSADQITSWPALKRQFAHVDDGELKTFLKFCIENKLMFEEDEFYLSLALASRPDRRDSHVVSEPRLEHLASNQGDIITPSFTV